MVRAGRIIRWSILSFLLLILSAAGVLWLMAAAVPTGYVRDLQALGEVKIQQLASKCDLTLSKHVVDPLQHGKPIDPTFTDLSINARVHQLIRSGQIALPQGISEPRVAFRPGRFVLMAKLKYGAIETVLSAECSPTVDAEGRLRLGLGSLKAGVLPMPRGVVDMLLEHLDVRIAELTQRRGQDEADNERRWLEGVRTLVTGGLLDTAALPGLQRDGYRLRRIQLTDGKLTVHILPEGEAG